MLSSLKIYSPFSKKVTYERHNSNIQCFFDYKKYVSMAKVCERLRTLDCKDLYDAISLFSKNHYKYRDTLYYNLQTIEVEQAYDEELQGYYVLDRNSNYLLFEQFDDIYHELMHVASSSIDKKNDLFYSGFIFQRDKKIVGVGITEGYVELLIGRDLANDRVLKNFNINLKGNEEPVINTKADTPYIYNNILARQLEIIVGKELMEEMFFNDGFNKLKSFLMQYKSEKEVMKFFTNSDISAIASTRHNIILNQRVLEAQKFLFDIAKEHMEDKLDRLEYEKLTSASKMATMLTSQRMNDEIISELNRQYKKK